MRFAHVGDGSCSSRSDATICRRQPRQMITCDQEKLMPLGDDCRIHLRPRREAPASARSVSHTRFSPGEMCDGYLPNFRGYSQSGSRSARVMTLPPSIAVRFGSGQAAWWAINVVRRPAANGGRDSVTAAIPWRPPGMTGCLLVLAQALATLYRVRFRSWVGCAYRCRAKKLRCDRTTKFRLVRKRRNLGAIDLSLARRDQERGWRGPVPD